MSLFRYFTALLILLVMLNGLWAAGVIPAKSLQLDVYFQTDKEIVKAMSFNIRYGTAGDGENSWLYRRKMVFKLIADQGADIVGLQEALSFQILEIQTALSGYSHVTVGRDDGKAKGEHCTIMFRKDRFDLAETGTFWFSDTPEEVCSTSWGNGICRICTWAKLTEKETNRQLYVYNVHLDHQSQESRVKSTALLAKQIAERGDNLPVIIMGDFNMDLENEGMKFLLAEESSCPIDLIHAWQTLNPDNLNLRTFHGFEGGINGRMIDHILVEPTTEVLAASIIRYNENGRYPSDHYPVTAMTKLSPTTK